MQPPQGYGPPQMPAQQPHGHPYPQHGPPQQRFQPPPKKSKLGWMLGAVGVVTVLIAVLLFAGCSALVSAINGGGSHEEKSRTMIARADNLPESDWQLVGRSDPKVESGCLSIDIQCVRLNATWSVPHEVSWEDAASRLGMDLERAKAGYYSGCRKAEEGDGDTAMLCISPSEEAENTWDVSIELRAK
jgi:hypothetical protein